MLNTLKAAFGSSLLFFVVGIMIGNALQAASPGANEDNTSTTQDAAAQEPQSTGLTQEQKTDNQIAIFAGGCFWCVESDFDRVPGVLTTISGYIGGNSTNPTYKTHSKDRHREAVEITFDPTITSYETLLDIFWRTVDPTDAGGQFCDRGHSYTTAIYTVDNNQFDLASASKTALDESATLAKPIATEITAASMFYPAEGYHQNYHKKNPLRYKLYRKSCGRDKSVKKVWGEQAQAGLAKH